MWTIEEIRQKFTIYDLILWSTLICFGIILVMMYATNSNTNSRRCLVYEDDPVRIIVMKDTYDSNLRNQAEN